MKYLFLAVFLSIIFSCSKNSSDQQLDCCSAPIYLSAVLEQTGDVACGKPLIYVEDTTALQYYPSLGGHRFILNELPDSLNFAKKKLELVITILPANREFACLSIGVNYPHVQFISGKTAP